MSSLGPVSAEQIRLRQQLAAWLTYLPVWGLRGVSSFQVELAYYRWDPAEYWEARPPNTPVTHGAHCRRKSRPEPDLARGEMAGVEVSGVETAQVGNTREIWWQVLNTACSSDHW